MTDNTPHNVSAANQRMMHDLVNKAYEAFVPALSELDKINDAFDKELQVILVDEKKPMTSLQKLG